MAVAAAFSIRGYAASMRGAAAAEGRRPFGIERLPPMEEAPRFRWWADELAAAVAAQPPPPPPPKQPQPQSRRTLGKARAPKKRSISDLFAAAPPLAVPLAADSGGGNKAPEVDDDEALCAIMWRTKEKKRRRRLEAAVAAVTDAAAAETPESEGNFAAKEALGKINLSDVLDPSRSSKKPDRVHHARTDEERSPDLKRRKKVKIINLEKSKKKKIDKKRYSESKKAAKVGKQHDLKKMLPLHSILKKYTKHTSVKMVKEKHGNAKGTEVIELCRKSVKRVKFSEVNDALGINKQSICKLFSDALASSSSSSTDMSSEGDKYIAAESSSSHMPEKALSKEASKDTDHEDSIELTSTQLSSNLIDLNEALPESTDLNYPYVSISEKPNPEPTQHVPLDSDVQAIDEGRQNQQDLSFDLHGPECQSIPEAALERGTNSVSSGTFFHSELMEVSDTHFVGPSLKLTGELAESHGDCSSGSVKDAMGKGKSPCALDSFQQHQKCHAFNLNFGGSQLSSEGEVPPCLPQECNASSGVASSFHSEMAVQQECRPAAGQTVRLMGKDLAVSTTRGEYLAETAQEKTTEEHPTKLFLELPRQGRPYLSLQAQSFSNVSANSASSSQSHIRYTASQNFTHSFRTVNALSGDQLQYEKRFRYLSDSQPHGNVLLGCPSLPSHGSAALHQDSSFLWRRYSDPLSRTASPSAPILPTTAQHATLFSVYHASMPQSYGVISAGSSVHHHNSPGIAFTHPGRRVEEASDSRRDAGLPSRNAENVAARAAIPDMSNSPSGGRFVQRSGPVKLSPGAKHILMLSDTIGNGTSIPVYSCISFGSRSGNISAPQKTGAELFKL